MRFYKEIKISDYSQLSDCFNQVHATNTNIGIYFDTINTVRIFANNEQDLNAVLSGKPVLETPESCKFIKCCRSHDADRNTDTQRVKRLEKLRLRWGDDFNPDMVTSRNHKPHYYVNMKSRSSGNSFRISVRHRIVTKETKGSFTSYGLSLNGSTVPLF